MGGGGVYLTTLSPGDAASGATWPSPDFRTNLLKANYGNDANSPARRASVDAVLVCFVNKGILEAVPERAEARVVHEVHVGNAKAFLVHKAIKLYDSTAPPADFADANRQPALVAYQQRSDRPQRHPYAKQTVLA